MMSFGRLEYHLYLPKDKKTKSESEVSTTQGPRTSISEGWLEKETSYLPLESTRPDYYRRKRKVQSQNKTEFNETVYVSHDEKRTTTSVTTHSLSLLDLGSSRNTERISMTTRGGDWNGWNDGQKESFRNTRDTSY